MWKYMTRRLRDSVERSANHFDKRSAAGVANSSNTADDNACKRFRGRPPCPLFGFRHERSAHDLDKRSAARVTASSNTSEGKECKRFGEGPPWPFFGSRFERSANDVDKRWAVRENKTPDPKECKRNGEGPPWPFFGSRFERNANDVDKRKAAEVTDWSNAPANDNPWKRFGGESPCKFFASRSRKCWGQSQNNNGTNSNRWNFETSHRSWIGAITWSGALVIGWYASNIIHLKLKYHYRLNKNGGCAFNFQIDDYKKGCSINNLLTTLQPYFKKDSINLTSKFEKIVENFTPTVYLIANDDKGQRKQELSSGLGSSTNPDHSDDALGEVLNSIENRLGLAAIENGQHQDGLNLLRSAANRNHAPALYNLGLCYEMGLGVPANEKSAMELYRTAAALEHPGALYNLGIYYGQGRGGLARDTETATRLLKLAAVQGQKEALEALKTLDEPAPVEPPQTNTTEAWAYRYLHHDNNMIPTHTSLFVENVNYLQSQTKAY